MQKNKTGPQSYTIIKINMLVAKSQTWLSNLTELNWTEYKALTRVPGTVSPVLKNYSWWEIPVSTSYLWTFYTLYFLFHSNVSR